MTNKTGILIMKYLWPMLFIAYVFLINPNTVSAITSSDNLNNLYESLLQREYAGPISFPDHQVERKAQRSPSLRLRFGRSDPEIHQFVEKRWFGDVNQKPIRSPSLRLRFGRRSDPSMKDNTFNMMQIYGDSRNFPREQRKPSGRLRWGRSILLDLEDHDLNQESDQGFEKTTSDVGETETLLALLSALKEMHDNQFNSNEFEREVRKQGPLRLRWGRGAENMHSNVHHKNVNRDGESTDNIISSSVKD